MANTYGILSELGVLVELEPSSVTGPNNGSIPVYRPVVSVGDSPGGGTAVTIADGADVTQGSKADAAATDSTSSWSIVSILKGLYARLVIGVTTLPYQGAVSAMVVTLTAATSAPLIAANSSRKGIRWQNVGANPATVVAGTGPAVVGNGFNYSPAGATGFQGGGESFEGAAVPTNAFAAISTLGTTIIVWEQT